MQDNNTQQNSSNNEPSIGVKDVIVRIKTPLFVNAVKYLFENNHVEEFSEFLRENDHSEVWVDAMTATSLDAFLRSKLESDDADKALRGVRCGCHSWKGPKFPEKPK
ncbi:MAG: hypothetical protein ACRC56_12825 [Bosea sp. (in: a-proteobacteria)]